MRKIMVAVSLVLILSGSYAHSMDIRKMTPMGIIGAGVVGGLTIEFVKWVRKEERYKQIWPFVKNYPGVSIAGVSAVIGLSLMYGRPLVSVLRSYSIVKKFKK
jgi:hypothetical protein